jgi:hypothetical protein
MIDEPGVYTMSADDYHDDPVKGGSLSSSGARRILECPARYHWERDHRPASTDAFDFGHAAHKLVLGAGPEVEVVDAQDWRTKSAKERRDAAYLAGKVPLLGDEWGQVIEMAQAIRRHPFAAAIFDPSRGQPEQVLVWLDEETGVWRRAMVDWLPTAQSGRRMVVADYKTTVSAHPKSLARSVASFGYHQQAPWYLDGVAALGLDEAPAFVFVAQEKTPPYLVTVFQLDETAMHIGAQLNRRALEVYRDCTAADVWPGYSTDVEVIALPRWAERQHEETYLEY